MKRIYPVALAVMLVAAFAVFMANTSMAHADEGNADSSAPSGLTATYDQEEDRVDFTWTPGTNPDYTAQMVLGKESSEADWSMLFYLESTIWSSASYSFDQGKSYVFVVAGVVSNNPLTYEGYSNEVTVTIPPAEGPSALGQQQSSCEVTTVPAPDPSVPTRITRPSNLTADASVVGEICLRWTPGHNPNYDKQVVRRRLIETSDWIDIDTLTDVRQSSYLDTTGDPGGRYLYRVSALKDNDNGGSTRIARATVLHDTISDNRIATLRSVRFTLPPGAVGELLGQVRVGWNMPRHPSYVYYRLQSRELGFRPATFTTVIGGPFRAGVRLTATVGVRVDRDYVFRMETAVSDADDARSRISEPAKVYTSPPAEQEDDAQEGMQ